MTDQPPICVDLDGTLLHTDTLFEGVLDLVRKSLWQALALPFWILKGRPKFKEKVAAHSDLDLEYLPFNQTLLERLKSEKQAGRRLVLVTGADRAIARRIAENGGLFEEYLASDGVNNLSGERKARELVSRYGAGGYDYVGDCAKDLPVWASARQALVVDPSPALERKAKSANPGLEVIRSGQPPLWRSLLKGARPHQWVKNLLVFVPLLTAMRLDSPQLFITALLTFLALSLSSSGIYLINDLWDLSADRRHVIKKNRPLASGRLSLQNGLMAAAASTILGLGLAILIGPALLAAVVLAKLVLSWLYSVYLKRKVILDIVVLANLYALRILAGGVATGVVISPWLWGVSIFFFLSLAFAKRCAEYKELEKNGQTESAGRPYQVSDLPLLLTSGLASGYLAILVFIIYMSSEKVKAMYAAPDLLWAAVPLLIYWLTRFWLLVQRGRMNQDPVAFVIKDRVSYLTALLVLAVMGVASL
jgi:4-hydroxybenzoate polyprenyltransferase